MCEEASATYRLLLRLANSLYADERKAKSEEWRLVKADPAKRRAYIKKLY